MSKDIFPKGYEFEEPILNAAEKGRLVFFIGAGVSRIMGIPGWEEFANKLIKKAFQKYNHQKMILSSIRDSKEKITIAYKEFEKRNELKQFYDCFGEAMLPDKNIFEEKEATNRNIYKILNKFQAMFITTNADDLFEKVIGSEFCYDDFSDPSLQRLQDPYFRATNRLFYLHGHYKEGEGIKNQLVFTADSYVSRYNDPDYQRFLKSIFQDPQNENVIIFIGYGLNEFELIDYLATKVGLSNTQNDKVYILYGFCSEEKILIQAKEAYFKALGITLIPFYKDDRGYDTLIDVLEILYERYSQKVVPLDVESIEHFATECNEENVAIILRYLKDSEKSKLLEGKIFKEISLHDKYRWAEALNDKGYFSSENLTKGIRAGKWSLLELFIEWIYENPDNKSKSQDAGVKFLSEITEEQLKDLSKTYSFIKNYIINIILSLDKEHIDNKYLDYITTLNINLDKFYTAIYPSCDFKNVFKWKKEAFEYFICVLFDKMVIKSSNDINYYYTDIILKKILQEATDNRDYIKILIKYFTDRLIRSSSEQSYNELLYKFNLDNLNEHDDGYYNLLLIVLKNCFNNLELEAKKHYLSGLLQLDSTLSKKLALYLARTNNDALDIDFSQFDFYSANEYYCEFFLFIKKLSELGNLNPCIAERIAKKVETADWGFYRRSKTITNEDKKYIDSKRLAILQILPCEYAEQKSKELKSDGIDSYKVIEIAKKCDVITVEEVKVLSKSDFDSIDIAEWVNYLKKVLRKSDKYELMTASQEFVGYLSDRSKDDKKIVINDLLRIPIDQLNYIVWAVFVKIEKFIDNIDEIISFSLSVLLKAKYERQYFALIKPIFYLLKKSLSFCTDVNLINNILYEINKCLTIIIDDEIYDSSRTDLYTFIINLGDYEKITLWLDCLIILKEKANRNDFDNEFQMVFELLNLRNDNIRYTLCYYYQNMNYVFGDKAKDLFNKLIYNNDRFDINALEICIAGSNLILDEYINIISSEYIENKNYPKENSHRNILEDKFYNLIIFAHYYNKINDIQMLSAFEDKNFLDSYFKNLSILSQMEKFNLEKQINIVWKYLNDINDDELKAYSKKVVLSIRFITKDGYTNTLLDTFIDAAKNFNENLDIIDFEKFIPFYNIDFNKAHELIKSIVEKLYYLSNDVVESLVETYKKENKIREGKELIIKLANQNIISIDKRTEFKKILEQ